MKKIIIIIVIFLSIIALGFGIYFAWKKSRQILAPPASEFQPTISDQSLTAVKQKLKIISDQPVFDYWISQPTSSAPAEIFYLNQNGQILKAKEAEDEVITSEPIENLQSVKASNDGKQVLIKSGDMQAPQFTIFNIETKVQQILSGITAADFSPDSKKIVYLETLKKNELFTGQANSNLIIKDLMDAKQKTTKILSINQKDFDLEWILPEKIILIPKPSAFYKSSAWLIDTKNKTLNLLGLENEGLMMNWSFSGKLGLEFVSHSSGREGLLNLINEQGQTQATIDFLTLPNKCVISEPKIYCAIPREIPPKIVLPDDYLKRAVYFEDLIYQIDINQNTITDVFVQVELVIDAVNLSLTNNQLFFINRYDNKLYQLDLDL